MTSIIRTESDRENQVPAAAQSSPCLAFLIVSSAVFLVSLDATVAGGGLQAQAGLTVTPGPLLVVPTTIVTGRLGHQPFLVGGSLLYACSGTWMLLVPGTQPGYLRDWLPGLLMSGAGVGLAFNLAVLTALLSCPINIRPR